MTTFIDEHGFLRGVPYHDGTLRALVFSGRTVAISVQSTDDQRHVLELHDVTAFRADEVREGNIILNIRLLTPKHVVVEPVLSQLVTEQLDCNASTLPEGATLLCLECSYGANVLALCSSWSVVRGDYTLVKS